MSERTAQPEAEEQGTTAPTADRARPERAFVLGLDGIPWELVHRWAAAGELPSFATLLEEGAAGPLESTVPASTPLAWPSIATGTWPDKHGLYWFQNLLPDGTHRMHTSDDLQQPPLWEQLTPAVVGNVPMTYPAHEIDGVLAAGMLSPGLDEDWAHPSDLAETVTEEIPDYRIGLDWQAYADRPDAFESDIADLVSARRRLMTMLLDRGPWRLGFFVYTAPDRLQHLCWDEDVLLEHYRQLDDVLAEVLERVRQLDAALFVVSDHGFGPVERTVSLPRVLERSGHLSRRSDSGGRGGLSRLGITKSSVDSWLETVGLDRQTVADSLPQSVVDAVANQVPGDHPLYDVDYERTEAFVHGSGCVYVNDTDRFEHGAVDPAETERVKREVTEAFERVTDPAGGGSVLRIYDGDERFPHDDRSPDLVVKGRDEYEGLTSLTDETFLETDAKAAGHRPEGMFFAWGPGIEPGSTPSDATVVDVAPTLLHALGEPIPERMDGRALEELFTDAIPEPTRSSDPSADVETDRTADRQRQGAHDDSETVEDRLRGLGYLE